MIFNRRGYPGFCLFGANNETISIGDDGSPATFERPRMPGDTKEYLAGIAAYRERTHPTDIPARYVKAYTFLDWLLRDCSKESRPIREEVFNCLAYPPNNREDIPKPICD